MEPARSSGVRDRGWYTYGMNKATVYLPDDLGVRLDAEAAATGVSRAEPIRRSIAMLLDASDRPRDNTPLPVFRSGRSRDVDEMREDIDQQVKQRSARR